MSDLSTSRDQFLELFIFETNQLIEQLEKIIIGCEKTKSFNKDAVNEIFRIMHTTKSSASMMGFTDLANLAHSLEDLFAVIRNNGDLTYDFYAFFHLTLAGIDFIKSNMIDLENGNEPKNTSNDLEYQIRLLINGLNESLHNNQGSSAILDVLEYEKKQEETSNLPEYCLRIYFDECGQSENIRGHLLSHTLKRHTTELVNFPKELLENSQSAAKIRGNGFFIFFNTTLSRSKIEEIIGATLFLRSYELKKTVEISDEWKHSVETSSFSSAIIAEEAKNNGNEHRDLHKRSDFMAVQVDKLDTLLNLVGEIVISESLVSKSPDLKGLHIDQFRRESDRLGKLVKNLQDIVIEMRMVSLENVFQKMSRTIISISNKLGKEITLEIYGENTEVDKKITEYLSDPLNHLIRNAADHGIENTEDRIKAGKPQKGTITISARQVAGEVWIIVEDDGKGIDRKVIYDKAMENGMASKPLEELSDKDIFAFVMMPGFSTKEKVTEFSGRGVGMDVVRENIEKIGGAVQIESKLGEGTRITLKIPLTLSIMGAMQVMIGASMLSIPITMIKESIIPSDVSITTNIDGKEIILLRGLCYPVIRLNRQLGIEGGFSNINDGILILVEGNEKSACLFVDKLIGQQQIVVKPLPVYIDQTKNAFSRCTILGDGSISLIMDINELLSEY